MANEKRLIDANALVKAIKSFRWFGVPNTLQLMFDYLKIIIRDQPTVDAVEVVRCKDCKHWHEETGWCNQHSHFIGSKGEACHHWESIDWKSMDADDFCSYGERRTDD